MKFVYFMIIFLSGIFMYKYVYIAFLNRKQALVSAIMYQSMPYLFCDIFMRGALNESFIFIYLPIIFLSFYYLFEEDNYNKFYLLFIVGYSLLIFTHLVMAIWLTLFLIPIMFLYYKKLFTKQVLGKLIKASLIILLITSNFWFPLLEHFFKGDYYIFNFNYSGEHDVYVLNLLYYIFPLIKENSNFKFFLAFNISPICLILMFDNFILLYKNRINVRDKKLIMGLVLFLILTLIFGSYRFVWRYVFNILKNIRFSWRLAVFISFASSVIGGYGIRLFKPIYQKYIIVFIVCFCGFSNYNYSSKLDYVDVDNINYFDTSCCENKWSYEYLPISSYDFRFLLSDSSNFMDNILRDIKILKNDAANMVFMVDNVSVDDAIILPRIYYLGYELYDSKGNKININQSDIGLIEALIDNNGIYYLEYKGTIIDRITKILSIVTIVSFVIKIVYLKIKK